MGRVQRRGAHSGDGLFRLSVDEVVHTSLRDDQKALVIQTWRPGAPLKRVDRE